MAGLAFSKDVKIVSILPWIAAAATDRTSNVIDTLGFNAMCVVVHNGTMAASATTALSLLRSDAASDNVTLTSGQAVAGTEQLLVTTDDDKIYFIDVANLDNGERYYMLKVDKNGTNNSDESAIVYLYNGSESPVTHGTGSGTGGGDSAVTGEFFTVTTEGSI